MPTHEPGVCELDSITEVIAEVSSAFKYSVAESRVLRKKYGREVNRIVKHAVGEVIVQPSVLGR